MLFRNSNIYYHGLVCMDSWWCSGYCGLPALPWHQLEECKLLEAIFFEYNDKHIPNNGPNADVPIPSSVMEYDRLSKI